MLLESAAVGRLLEEVHEGKNCLILLSGSVHRPFGAAWMVGLGKSVADKYQVDDRCLNIFDHV